MADPRALVTDTHPLLFHARGGSRLGSRAKKHFDACERGDALLYVPSIVIWEVSLLVRCGKIDLRRSVRSFFQDLFSNPAYEPVELTTDQICLADEQRPNEDPFDALICASALSLKLPLITADSEIEESGLVRVVW